MSDIRGIHYEISKPAKNPKDGYYYQRVRQVDENGNLVGVGEQVYRSATPDSTDGLFGLPIDLGKSATLAGDVGQMALGGATRNLRTLASGAMKFAHDVMSGITDDYRSWPGTDKPWQPPFDWRTGSPPLDFARGPAGEVGGGNGVGNWWDTAQSPRQNLSQNDAWANVPTPDFSPPPLRGKPAWNQAFVRDSAAAASVPSRNNVFEYGFPSQNKPGGLPGLMAEVGGIDQSNPDQQPVGGLLGLIQQYMRNNSDGATR